MPKILRGAVLVPPVKQMNSRCSRRSAPSTQTLGPVGREVVERCGGLSALSAANQKRAVVTYPHGGAMRTKPSLPHARRAHAEFASSKSGCAGIYNRQRPVKSGAVPSAALNSSSGGRP